MCNSLTRRVLKGQYFHIKIVPGTATNVKTIWTSIIFAVPEAVINMTKIMDVVHICCAGGSY